MACAALLLLCASLAGGCGAQPAIVVNGIRPEEAALLSGAGDVVPGSEAAGTAAPEASGSIKAAGAGETGGGKAGAGESEAGVPSESELVVYVCGAVKKPDVYDLPAGARVRDAVEAAGGFAESADREWLNQARRLQDEEMLIVFTREETAVFREDGKSAEGGIPAGEEASASGGKVDLNRATKEQLMTLPGIGEAKAAAIIRDREENGPFSGIEDVMRISGIKESVFSGIRDFVTVG